MDYLDLPIDAQNKLAELEGMSRTEYIAHLEYLANETLEQFEARIATTPPKDWTDADTKHLLNKMSVNPQLEQ